MKAEQQEGCGLKTYKIGEIAKMLGISAETIRNYEKKGLICPYKEESNYRYFDIIQI
ncbi:MAG: MerR family transcriptional regulator, partial [Clostridium sp.]